MTVIDDVKSRLDILEVVSGYVSLQRSGRSYKANCPFHQEKTPSFYVFPDRQSWRCFGGCATGGDAFSFVMRAENLDFPEALKRLAQQTGVALPSRERRTEQQSALQINESAQEYFQQFLSADRGAAARAYLEGRGLTGETVQKFGLGLSPGDGESLRNHLTKVGFSPEQLVSAGIVHRSENGRYRDLFRGRLMIPIRNGQGELGGFGSRALDDSKPKYLNSPRTPVFDKGRILYGLYLAREAVREQGVVVVEGYMDAIMAHQNGFANVVASMGTALTEHQVAEIRRLTSDVTMALDADAAGQQATLRSLESSWQVFQNRVAGQVRGTTLFQRQDIPQLKVAVLPPGMDPDEVIRQSPEEWTRLVQGGVPLFQYLLPALCAQVDASTPQGKARVVELLFPFIAAVPEPIQQDQYFQMLATQLGVSEETLRASVGRFASRATPPSRNTTARRPVRAAGADEPPESSAFVALDRDPLEEYCLALLLQHPELRPLAAELRPEYFRRVEHRELLNRLMSVAPSGGSSPEGEIAPVAVLKQEVGPELTELVEALAEKKMPPLEPKKESALGDAVRRLEQRYLRDRKVEEGLKFTEEAPEALEDLYQQALELNHRIKLSQFAGSGTGQPGPAQ